MRHPAKNEDAERNLVMTPDGIIVERNTGGGHDYSHRAYFAVVRQKPRMTARQYVHKWGFAKLVEHGHAAEGNSPQEAVEKLLNHQPITSKTP